MEWHLKSCIFASDPRGVGSGLAATTGEGPLGDLSVSSSGSYHHHYNSSKDAHLTSHSPRMTSEQGQLRSLNCQKEEPGAATSSSPRSRQDCNQ